MTRLYVVAARAHDFAKVQDWLDMLDASGADVRLLTVERHRNDAGGGGARPELFLPTLAKRKSRLRKRLIRKAARACAVVAPKRLRLLLSLRYGTLPAGQETEAAHYIALSDRVAWPESWAKAKRKTYVVVSPPDAAEHLATRGRHEISRRYADLINRMRTGRLSPATGTTRSEWRFLVTDPRVRRLGFDMGDYPSDAIRLATHAFPEAAQSILDLADAQHDGKPTTVEHDAAQEIVSLSQVGDSSDSTMASAARLGAAADAAYESGDLDRAVSLFTHLLTLVFHPRLHTSSASSPIVENPEEWLAPIRRSKIRRDILSRALPRTSSTVGGGQPPRVTILRGSYPGFSRPVVDAAEDAAFDTVAVIPGDEDRLMAGVGPNRDVVRILLGLDTEPSWEWLATAERSTHLFIDWADRAAAVALSRCSADRIVLRIHSADLLSCWVHLLPLDRVDEIIVVSEPMADLVRRVVDVPVATPIRTLPNLIDVERLDRPKGPAACRTVAVVGWAQKVKDPLWALEVLAFLRRSDPAWRLVFVGNDFDARGTREVQEYAARFRQRMLEDDVRGGVEFVGYTHDLPSVFQGVGFVLSSSLRESFGVALMEGIASRAVPVVRDWPTFRPVDAARRVTDPQWVVEQPQEAADAILRRSDESDRAAAGASAREWLQSRVATADVTQRYLETITGRAKVEAGAQTP